MAKKKGNKSLFNTAAFSFKNNTFVYHSLPQIKQFASCVAKTNNEICSLLKEMNPTHSDINSNTELNEEELLQLCLHFDFELRRKKQFTYENYWDEIETSDLKETLDIRPPIVTVMGHIDHGKTTLLDYLRKSNVVAKEHGKITQNVSAYQVKYQAQNITFLDTPGHHIFAKMRYRSTKLTDIVVLVVSAEEGVKNQTKEIYQYLTSASLPIIIFLNKMDKRTANADKVLREFEQLGIITSEWGGEILCIKGSALTGKGVDELLDAILLLTKQKKLMGNYHREANGIVIDTLFNKQTGPVCRLLIKGGVLNLRDWIITPSAIGKIKAIKNENNNNVTSAFPSQPVSVIGFDKLPAAGDPFVATQNEMLVKSFQNLLNNPTQETKLDVEKKIDLESLLNELETNQQKSLNVMVYADASATLETITETLTSMSAETETKLQIIAARIGHISEIDIGLAKHANVTLILGMNIKYSDNIAMMAKEQHIEIKNYRVIYELIDHVQELISPPIATKQSSIGACKIKQVFPHSKLGNIAGCIITDGMVKSKAMVNLIREEKIIFHGKINSLKQRNQEMKALYQGDECGIILENWSDFRINDTLEILSGS